MTTRSFYTRQMLLRYSKQLVAARRLARYERLIGRERLDDPATAEAKRHAMVERVAREIMENLIFSGSDNPIVREVQDQLSLENGEDYVFRYPPAEQDFQVFRATDTGEEELTPSEKQLLMGQLWDVTLRTVDATML